MHRYDCSLYDVLYGSINSLISSYVNRSVDESVLCRANFLIELIMLRDGSLSMSDCTQSMSTDELKDIIDFICTSQLAH